MTNCGKSSRCRCSGLRPGCGPARFGGCGPPARPPARKRAGPGRPPGGERPGTPGPQGALPGRLLPGLSALRTKVFSALAQAWLVGAGPPSQISAFIHTKCRRRRHFGGRAPSAWRVRCQPLCASLAYPVKGQAERPLAALDRVCISAQKPSCLDSPVSAQYHAFSLCLGK